MDSAFFEFLNKAIGNEEFVVFGGIAIIAISIVFIKTVGSTIRSVAGERTRREIAAYIAEGSMSPEQGERLMKAGKEEKGGCC